MTTDWSPVPVSLAHARISANLQSIVDASVHTRRLLECIESNRKSWALVGGAPRVWATLFPDKPKDIDIVVGADMPLVAKVVAEWSEEFDSDKGVRVERTRFGGYRLVNPSMTLDVWPASSTVSLERGWAGDSNLYRAVAKSAALSMDSLVFTSRGAVYDRGFFHTLTSGILRLNHCNMEGKQFMARKAVRLCEAYGLIPDFSVQHLISTLLGSDVLTDLLSFLNDKLRNHDGSSGFDLTEQPAHPVVTRVRVRQLSFLSALSCVTAKATRKSPTHSSTAAPTRTAMESSSAER